MAIFSSLRRILLTSLLTTTFPLTLSQDINPYTPGEPVPFDCRLLYTRQARLNIHPINDGTSELSCAQVKGDGGTATAGGHTARFYWDIDDWQAARADHLVQIRDHIRSATISAFTTYAGHCKPLNVAIILSSSTSDRAHTNVYGATKGVPRSTRCVISMQYFAEGEGPFGRAGGIEDYKQSIAHEIYHCVEIRNNPEVMFTKRGALWWVDGAADFQSNIVFPGTNLENSAREASLYSPSEPLIDQQYPASLFFQYLANKGKGPKAITQMIAKWPPGVGTDAEAARASKNGDIGGVFPGFAQALADKTIKDTSGEMRSDVLDAASPEVQNIQKPSAEGQSTTTNLHMKYFTVQRYQMQLGKGEKIEVVFSSGQKAVKAWSKSGKKWSEVPRGKKKTFTGSCKGSGSSVDFLVTSTDHRSTVDANFKVTMTKKKDCEKKKKVCKPKNNPNGPVTKKRSIGLTRRQEETTEEPEETETPTETPTPEQDPQEDPKETDPSETEEEEPEKDGKDDDDDEEEEVDCGCEPNDVPIDPCLKAMWNLDLQKTEKRLKDVVQFNMPSEVPVGIGSVSVTGSSTFQAGDEDVSFVHKAFTISATASSQGITGISTVKIDGTLSGRIYMAGENKFCIANSAATGSVHLKISVPPYFDSEDTQPVDQAFAPEGVIVSYICSGGNLELDGFSEGTIALAYTKAG